MYGREEKQTVYRKGKKPSTPKTQNIGKPFILEKSKEKLNIEYLEAFGHFLKQKKKKKK